MKLAIVKCSQNRPLLYHIFNLEISIKIIGSSNHCKPLNTVRKTRFEFSLIKMLLFNTRKQYRLIIKKTYRYLD